MAEQSENRPTLKIIRHEYLGHSKIMPVTVRERPLPESYQSIMMAPISDQKHFELHSSKGDIGPENTSKLRSVQLLRRAKIRKPIKTTGESDAKIRMPPPKFPPPRFVKKKKVTNAKPSGATLKPTLQPVEESNNSAEKNYLNFVPFELPKVKLRTTSSLCSAQNMQQPDSAAAASKPQEKSGRVSRLITAKRRKQKLIKKLRPAIKMEETDEALSGKRIRKLVDSWAQKLGSLARRNECLQKCKPKPASQAKNALTHPTKAQLKQTESPRVTAGSVIRLKNRFLLGKYKTWMATYQTHKVVPSSSQATDEYGPIEIVPSKSAVSSNPLISHTIELLRYKRHAEAIAEDVDMSVAPKLDPFPVIPTKIPKGELLLQNIPLTPEEVRSVLMKRLSVLVAHSGYTHTKLQPMEMLADAVYNFMLELTTRLKQVKERELAGVDHGFPDPIERVLVEVGMGGVRGLEEYYKTKVIDYHRRMVEQCNYIRSQYMNRNRVALSSTGAPLASSSTITVDLASELEKATNTTAQTKLVESSTVRIRLKETLGQHSVLRLNFEESPSLSCGAQLTDADAMKS